MLANTLLNTDLQKFLSKLTQIKFSSHSASNPYLTYFATDFIEYQKTNENNYLLYEVKDKDFDLVNSLKQTIDIFNQTRTNNKWMRSKWSHVFGSKMPMRVS